MDASTDATTGATTESATPPITQVREISDAQTMRALAHPVRIELMDVLSLDGPLTATQAGARIGQSATTCSFHLRQLQKYGFVEEAGGGRGRARPWKMTSIGMRFSSVQSDTETTIAADALSSLLRKRQFERYQRWLDTRTSYSVAWQQVASSTDLAYWITAEELKELNDELMALLLPKWRERLLDASTRPEGALPVEVLLFSYPVRELSGQD